MQMMQLFEEAILNQLFVWRRYSVKVFIFSGFNCAQLFGNTYFCMTKRHVVVCRDLMIALRESKFLFLLRPNWRKCLLNIGECEAFWLLSVEDSINNTRR